ncbi:hypothetical protein TCAL_01228 [Tigriopus californicus]|uniref:40S ribosomal protein S12 n=1 Tax=Tigriopus californicus TaxID=6832 RepID=A0A553NXK2_TIGCA|nr:small ribosomal subunit protein eS12-like [Tigriopus californicus]TRY70156.1 hypothetical protein TCAL_01228 [Tigriopus californicus]|eukprot:TCALIF_01228-PA protein Name:"Similar to rps12 40S ribosomal protein S12 (Oreochromis niloticus)" AED:0.00 eAED:0.00 QI:0/-1/0/1/-1/1/1/0/141
MSDVEGDDVPTPVVAPTGGAMDKDTAIKEVLKAARIHDGLARGLHETVKALDKRQAHLCLLADDCDEPSYKKLVQALCQEHNIPLLTVDDKFQLGEWAGICKLDTEGKARKVVKCSSVAIRDWGKETPAHDVIQEYIKSQK